MGIARFFKSLQGIISTQLLNIPTLTFQVQLLIGFCKFQDWGGFRIICGRDCTPVAACPRPKSLHFCNTMRFIGTQ